MGKHEITQDVNQVVVFSACSLEVEKGEALLLGNKSTKTEGVEILEGEDIVLAVALKHGRGKIVVLGTHYVFQDDFMTVFDNKIFVENMFAWFAQENDAGLGVEVLPMLTLAFILYKFRKNKIF